MASSILDIFIRLKDQASKGLKNIKTSAAGVNKEFDELDKKKTDKLEKEIKDLDNALKEAQDQTEKTNRNLDGLRNASLAIAGIGAALAAPFILGAKAAAAFSIEIAEIETLVDTAKISNEELRQTVIDLSNEFGQTRSDIAAGLYQTISSGAQAGAEANEVLRVALLAARGGVTSVEEAVNGLSTVLNAFNLAASQAEDVADSLFVTVKGGRTTFGELAGFLFQAAPLASALGVTFTDLNAALVAVTKTGTPTRNAFTQIRSALQGVIRDTPELTVAFRDFESASDAIRKIGIAGVFQLIRDAAGGSEAELIKLVGSIEGVQAILSTTDESAAGLNKALEDQETRLGAAAAAAATVEEAFGVKLQTSLIRVQNAFEILGATVAPVILSIVEPIGDLAVSFQKLLESSAAARGIATATFIIAGLAVGLGVLGVVVVSVIKGIVALRLGMQTLGNRARRAVIGIRLATFSLRGMGAAAASALGPIGIAITLISLLGGAMAAAADETEEFNEEVEELADNIANFRNLSVSERVATVGESLKRVERLEEALIAAKDAVITLNRRGGIVKLNGIESAIEKVADLEAQIEGATEDLTSLTDQFDFDETVNLRVDILPQLRTDLEEAERLVLAAEAELKAAIDATNDPLELRIEKQVRGGRVAKSNAKAVADQAESAAELVVLKTAELEKARGIVRISEIEIEKTQEKLDAAQDILDTADAEKLTRQEILDLLKEQISLQKVLGKGFVSAEQNRLKEFKAESKLLEAEDKASLRRREINEQEFFQRRQGRAIEEANLSINVTRAKITAAVAEGNAKLAEIRTKIEQGVEGFDDSDLQLEEQKIAIRIAALESELVQLVFAANTTLANIGEDLATTGVEGIRNAFEEILDEFRANIDNIKNLEQTGLISPTQARSDIAEESEKAQAALLELRAELQRLGFDLDDPRVIALFRDLDEEIRKTGATLSAFAAALKVALESATADFFDDVFKDLDNISDAFDDLVTSIGDSIRRLIAEKLANKLIESLFGGSQSILGGFLSKDGGKVAGGGYIKAAGGGIMKLADGGGRVRGRGTKTSDSVGPLFLSSGEYVMKAKAVDRYGLQMMEAINQGLAPAIRSPRRLNISRPRRTRFQEGGVVGSPPNVAQLVAGASAVGQAASRETTGELVLNVPESTLNMLMRDVLEREFGRILSRR